MDDHFTALDITSSTRNGAFARSDIGPIYIPLTYHFSRRLLVPRKRNKKLTLFTPRTKFILLMSKHFLNKQDKGFNMTIMNKAIKFNTRVVIN
jgi:hypothetical protein